MVAPWNQSDKCLAYFIPFLRNKKTPTRKFVGV
jgi:hypothetical protein